MKRLEHKVAIITGGGAGLGQGAAIAMAKEGALISIAEINLSACEETVSIIRSKGGKALGIQCDVGVREQVNSCVEMTVKEFGTIDILLNNAMAAKPNNRVENISDDELDFDLRSGLYGVLYFMQAVFPIFRAKKYGKIINVGSGTAMEGVEGRGAYGSVKGAVLSLTRTAGREWGEFGITVNMISPIALNSHAEADMKTNPEKYEMVAKKAPLRRWGRAEQDFGRTVVWLASEDADYITTNNILVDGGLALTR
jgi:NAD(P)-dependent dehydrogenase (short-subunit alcohol dehydrogenase family)